jgi:hypothetical protein
MTAKMQRELVQVKKVIRKTVSQIFIDKLDQVRVYDIAVKAYLKGYYDALKNVKAELDNE